MAGNARRAQEDRGDVLVPRHRRPDQLPAGRHGIPPEQVASHQRQRILRAICEAHLALGLGNMSVEDTVQRAGVSRRTFYNMFMGFDEAYCTTVEAVTREIAFGLKEKDKPLESLFDLINNDPASFMICACADGTGIDGQELHDKFVRVVMRAIYNKHSIAAELRVRGLIKMMVSRIMVGSKLPRRSQIEIELLAGMSQ